MTAVSEPDIRDTDVLIYIVAIGINPGETQIRQAIEPKPGQYTLGYELSGKQFDIKTDPMKVRLDVKECKNIRCEGGNGSNQLTERYLKAGKLLTVQNLSSESDKLIKRATVFVNIQVIIGCDLFVQINI